LTTDRQSAETKVDISENRPVVVVPGGEPALTYARSGSLVLPLRFAQRMLGWQSTNGYLPSWGHRSCPAASGQACGKGICARADSLGVVVRSARPCVDETSSATMSVAEL